MRREIRKSGKEAWEDLGRLMMLRNLFLMRRARDPGFSKYVVSQLRSHGSILEKTKRYIVGAYSSLDPSEELELFLPAPAESPRSQATFVAGPTKMTLPFEGMDALAKGFEANRQNTLRYLSWRMEKALESGDDDELRAVQWYTSESTSGTFDADILFRGDELYEGSTYRGTWHLENARFMTLNLRASRLYFGGMSPVVAIARMLVFESADIAEFFTKVLGELDPALVELSRADPLKWNKYLNNAESIAAVTWFMSLPFGEKLSVLNSFYDFTVTRDEVARYLRDASNEVVVSIAQGLFLNDFYQEAAEVYKFCADRPAADEILHVCLDGAATAMRRLREFGEARTFHEKDLEVVSKLGFPKRTYAMAVAHKNAGEMAWQTGDRDAAGRHLRECLNLSESLGAAERAVILWNLACAHWRIGNYDEELRYLSKALDLGLSHEVAALRVIVLNHPEHCLPDGRCDVTRLAELDAREELSKLRRFARASFDMFQFRRQREWLSLCRRIQDSEVDALDVAESLYLEGHLEDSKAAFDAALDPQTKSVFGLAYRGLIELAADAERDCREFLRRALLRCFEVVYPQHYFDGLWDHVLRELLRMKGEETTVRIMEDLTKAVDGAEARARFLYTLGESFSIIGFLVRSLDAFDRILRLDLSPQSNAKALFGKGTVLSRWGRFDQAVRVLGESLATWRSDETRISLAMAHAWNLNFPKAAELAKEVLSLHPGPPLEGLYDQYANLASRVINLNAVKDEGALGFLRTAETLALKSLGELESSGALDYSLSIVEYGKAAETMLHERVGLPARERVSLSLPKDVIDKHVRATKGPESLPYPLRTIMLNKERSIGVGGWGKLGTEEKQHAGNPVYEAFLGEVKSRLQSGGLALVNGACSVISQLRNPSSHRDAMSQADVQAAREKVVRALNDIIAEVYP